MQHFRCGMKYNCHKSTYVVYFYEQMEKDDKMQKILIWPVNDLQSTHSLVRIHNTLTCVVDL